MNTISEPAGDVRRRRRMHSDELKANTVAACMCPGMSMAAVAMAHGIHANLLRRWVHATEVRIDLVLLHEAMRVGMARRPDVAR